VDAAITGALTLPTLPVPPLIDIIIQYAIEDFTVTQLIGQTKISGDADNCSGLKAELKCPCAIAVVQRTDEAAGSDKLTAEGDEYFIADTNNEKFRLYSVSSGI
jgi:hypothetical protein